MDQTLASLLNHIFDKEIELAQLTQKNTELETQNAALLAENENLKKAFAEVQ